ncbi:MAG TPA: LamG domain-containing protein [Polyangiaceae bacterium]|jgi:hypothetical protein
MWRLLLLAALGGCALVVDLDGLQSGGSPDASTDAGDAGIAIDAGDASSDASIDVGTYRDEVNLDTPSSWWRLGETSALQIAKDENNFAPGQYSDAGVTFGVQGALANDGNTAITLDGNTGAVIMPGADYVLDGLPAFTIEIWVSPAAAIAATQRLVSHRTSSNADGWVLYLDSMLPTFQELASGTALANLTAGKALDAGKYTHVVVTGDGSTLTMYIDGQPSGNQVTQASVPTTVAPGLVLGSSSGVAQEFFKGKLDEAAIYIKCLSAQRVLAHYLAATH